MTILTNIRRLNMGRALSDRLHAVMAAKTIAHDVCVIEVCRDPAIGGMAIVARISADNMVGILTFGDRAVMTAHALT